MAQLKPTLVEDPNDPGTYLIQNMASVVDSGSGTGTGYNPGAISHPTVINWGNSGDRFYETGIDRGVLYLENEPGIAWSGLIGVSESPDGGEAVPYYIDGVKYVNDVAPEEFKATIEAYTYPDEFALCDGSASMAQGLFIEQQRRRSFGLSYRTRIGNDIDGIDHGYKIHIVYNAQVDPTERTYDTISDDAEAMTFSWDISTRPVKFQDDAFGVKYGSHLVLDSRKVYPWALEAIEKILYGFENTAAALPNPQSLLAIFVDNALLQIIDNGDGTWTATGPDAAITMLDATTFQIDWPSAIMLDEESYLISSL